MKGLIFLLFSGISFAQELSVFKKFPEAYSLTLDYQEFYKRNKNTDQSKDFLLENFLSHEFVVEQLLTDVNSLLVYYGYENNKESRNYLNDLKKKIENRTLSKYHYEIIGHLSSQVDELEIFLSNTQKIFPVSFLSPLLDIVSIENLKYFDILSFVSKNNGLKLFENEFKVITRIFHSNVRVMFEFGDENSEFAGYRQYAYLPLTDQMFQSDLVKAKYNEKIFRQDYQIKKDHLAYWFSLEELSIRDIVELTLSGVLVEARTKKVSMPDGIVGGSVSSMGHDRVHNIVFIRDNKLSSSSSSSVDRNVFFNRIKELKNLYLWHSALYENKSDIEKAAMLAVWFEFLHESSGSLKEVLSGNVGIVKRRHLSFERELRDPRKLGISKKDWGIGERVQFFSEKEIEQSVKSIQIYANLFVKDYSSRCHKFLRF